MKRNTLFLDSDLDEARASFTKQLEGVYPGQLLLVKYADEYALMRYESHSTEVETDHIYRLHRGMYIGSVSRLLDSPDQWPKVRDTDRYKGNVFASKCLKFKYDPEFDIYWPTSWHRDVFVRMATRYSNGHVLTVSEPIEVIRGLDAIRARMRLIVRPHYFESVIEPFMSGEMTKYRAPRWRVRTYYMGGMFGHVRQYARVAERLERGSFIYVGCKEEVYLFGVAKESNGSIFWMGTYTASTKPPLYFTNARLDHNSAREDDDFICNCFNHGFWGAFFRLFDRAAREKRRRLFLCPQMGRKQNCKYSVFSGHPEIITGNLKEALAHFATTDFSEYGDIVERYAKEICVPHPTLRSNGYGFYM